MDFQYYLPVNLQFGCDKINILGQQTRIYGKKALLVTGTSSTKKTGLLERAITLLEEAGVGVVVFDKVTPNPLSSLVYKGVKEAKKEGCDVVVAIGGGSIIDCAKAIAYSFYNEGEIFDYIYGIKEGNQTLPLIAVPTTCGTGSEGNCFAVLTHPETKDKKSLRNIVCVPKVSIIDPKIMTTMPGKVAASVMFDAFCHNLEAYISKACQPLVEIQALYAMELLIGNMFTAYRDHNNLEAWSKVALASTIGGMNINMTGVTAVHGMEHPASGCRNIVHGRGLAALAPVIYRETIDFAPHKFEKVAKLLGGDSAGDFVERFDDLLEKLELKTTLSKEGVISGDVEWMTDNCLKVSAASMNAHPKVFTREEIKEIYYLAL